MQNMGPAANVEQGLDLDRMGLKVRGRSTWDSRRYVGLKEKLVPRGWVVVRVRLRLVVRVCVVELNAL